jgi:hypothetical protein
MAKEKSGHPGPAVKKVLCQMLGWGPAAFPHMDPDSLYLYVSRILALARSKFLNPYAFRFITFVWLLIPSKKPFVQPKIKLFKISISQFLKVRTQR